MNNQQSQEPRFGQLARECTSTAGLSVLFAAVWFMVSRGQCDGSVALLGGTMLASAGLVIAVRQRWRLMAHVTIAVALANQCVALAAGLGWLKTGAGLTAIFVPLMVLLLRTRWVDVAVSSVCSALTCLLIFAVKEQLTSGLGGTPLILWDAAVATVGSIGVLFSLFQLRRDGAAPIMSISTAVGVMICLGPLFGGYLRWMLLPSALVAGFGGLYHVLDDRRSWPGPVMALLGIALGILIGVCAGAGGVVLICACLALLAAIALMFAAARTTRWLATIGWLACATQLGVVGLSHPTVTGGAGLPWSPAWFTWCAVASLMALELTLLILLTSGGELASLTPTWVRTSLKAGAVVLAGAAASTVLHVLLKWPPLITMVWAACALLCARLRGTATWLSPVAGLAAAASAVKLIGWDWPQLGIAARFELLLVVGTVLLVSPLLNKETDRSRSPSMPPDRATEPTR